jgi:hypothetical protein
MIKVVISLACIGIALVAMVGCSQPPPQVYNYINLDVSDQNARGCLSIEPDADWVESLVKLPAKVETLPKSIRDVKLTLLVPFQFSSIG